MATRSLEPGTLIARYRVVSLLGAGGMGEVYLARDESLDRSVALKVLPPDLVRNDERVRRFVQEAKSASSLNHPHIVTIYEIGEAEIDVADGAPGERIQFIAMELVSGHTLKTLIHQEKADLRTLVRSLAQAADGVAKAHAAGIVHRDLKPENIMVTSDGFAKVVDFGLAKLTETAAGADPANVSTVLGRATGEGMVLGTVGYMSPEQVQGKTVDHRSDIFSLGCVIYEAATRQRPFQADSDVETLHKILKDAPPPVEEINPKVPADLRRVIRRCLAKSPDRRLQSMKDAALDLSEIDETYETLSVSSGSGTTTSALGAAGVTPSSRLWPITAILIGLAGLGFGGWQWLAGSAGSRSSSAALEVTTVARIPDMTVALMSADGRFLAFTQSQAGRFSLVVRQVATNQDVVVVPPQDGEIWLKAVAPDSSYVYFSSGPGPQRLYRVPAVGGEPRRVLEQGQVRELAMSADGSRLAAVLEGVPSARRTLVIANADGTEPRTLASFPVGSVYAPAWSPDGRYVVVSVTRIDSRREQLTAFATSDGTSREVGGHDWGVYSAVWSADGRTIIVAAHEWSAPGFHPLWAVSWPDGATRRITSDSNSYNDAPMVLSADGQTITTALIRADVSLYGAPADRPNEAAPLPGDAPRSGFLTPLPGGRLLYRAFDRGPRALWTMASDGTRRQRITTERMDVNAVAVATRADVIVVETSEGLAAVRRLWRMDSSGGGLAELPGGGSVQVLSVSPDGAHLFYRKRDPATSVTSPEVWRRPIGGGDEENVGDRPPVFSPDGRLLYRLIERTMPGPRQVEIAEVETGRVLKTLTTPSPDFSNIRWTPSSDALLGVPRPETVANIWRVPIDGGEATQLTRFGPGQFIPSFAYTADGRLLFLRPERASGEVVQFRNFR